jgi:hypothetical protein
MKPSLISTTMTAIRANATVLVFSDTISRF